jgi:hypothetical protein
MLVDVYLEFDNLLSDTEGFFFDTYKSHYSGHNIRFYEDRMAKESFHLDSPIKKVGTVFIHFLENCANIGKISILSYCPPKHFHSFVDDKAMWLNYHGFSRFQYHFVDDHKLKKEYSKKNSILVDTFMDGIRAFNLGDGVGNFHQGHGGIQRGFMEVLNTVIDPTN